VNIKSEYGVGSKFKKMKNVYGLSGDDKNSYVKLYHKEDEVLILLFWNTVNIDSVTALKQINS